MNPQFRKVFDLVSNPEGIQPPYGFYFIFVVIGLLLIALAIAARRFGWRQRIFLSIFAVAWVGFLSVFLVIDFRDVAAIRSAVRHGEIQRAEGCLAYFRPGLSMGSKSTIGNEQWTVDGNVFDYGAGEARPGYHVVEPNGGVVHGDSRVRVFFVISQAYRRNEIVRIDTINHGCPLARLVEPGTQP